MYDYVAGKDVALVPNYTGIDGVWDLNQVRDLILAGSTIEAARKSIAAPQPKPAPGPAPVGGLTPPAAIKALNFTPVQAAALGLTAAELKNGLSATQVAAIKAKTTPARAVMLKLTAAQKSFLGLPA